VSDDDLEASDDLEVIHRLTHLMQGSVDMESETESGTVFTITLPREFDADSAASSGDASSDDTFPLA
jgi:sensor histidine kinase regulating citrate/malate metabolism